jgi:hypothetical protein
LIGMYAKYSGRMSVSETRNEDYGSVCDLTFLTVRWSNRERGTYSIQGLYVEKGKAHRFSEGLIKVLH